MSGYRTTAYVVSPYTKRRAVVSTQYNQTSLLRTMELILGLAADEPIGCHRYADVRLLSSAAGLSALHGFDQQHSPGSNESGAEKSFRPFAAPPCLCLCSACLCASPINAQKTCSIASCGTP